jgi:ribosome-binding factor A
MVRKRRDPQPERGHSQRPLRVGEEMRHALSRILSQGELRDPALQGISITVAEVSVSPDLRRATAFVMPLGGANSGAVLAALGRSASFLRGRVARELSLRHAPEIVFALDRSFEHAERISALLSRPEVERDLHPAAPEEPDHDG